MTGWELARHCRWALSLTFITGVAGCGPEHPRVSACRELLEQFEGTCEGGTVLEIMEDDNGTCTGRCIPICEPAITDGGPVDNCVQLDGGQGRQQ